MEGHILVVDDDDLMIKIIEKLLRKEGFQVTCARDGMEAIQKARGQVFDLIICDVRMPGIDGLETLGEVKKIQPDARNVVITAYASEDAPIKAIKIGVDDYIYKPFDVDEFLNSIKKTLENYRKTKQKQNIIQEIKQNYQNLVKSLALSLEKRDSHREGHSQKVARFATQFARQYHFSEEKQQMLEMAAMLHDLGQIEVKQDILSKPDTLTEEEKSSIAEHPVAAKRLMQPILDFHRVLPAVLYHHERYDGTGYPEGLKGEQIPMEARILSVVDTFVALQSDRPYRKRFSGDEAVNILREGSGTQFDPKIVEDFIAFVSKEGGEEEEDAAQNIEAVVTHVSPKHCKGLIGLGQTYLEIGDYKTARFAFQEILTLGDEVTEPEILAETHCGIAQILAAQNRWNEALEEVNKAIQIAGENRNNYLMARSYVILGHVLTHLAMVPRAEEILQKALEIFTQWEDNYQRARCLLFLADLYRSLPDREAAAREAVVEALEITRRRGYDILFDKEKAVVIPLLVKALEYPPLMGYAGGILRRLSRYAAESLAALSSHPDPKVKALASEILQDVAPSPTPVTKEKGLRTFLLGQFRVLRGDEPIKEEEWKTRKTKYLLAYLVANKDRQISEDKIIDVFWPHLSPEKAKHNLHNTTYLLRKILEPVLSEGADSQYIWHKKNFYRFQPDSLHWVDIEDFDKRCLEGKTLLSSGKQDEAIQQFQEAERLYEGDFLEDNLYDDWTLYKRDKLQEQYFEVLLRLADYFIAKGKHDVAITYANKILQKDKCFEKGYVTMMKALLLSGRRDEAVRCYHTCVDTLKKELNLSASPETVALYLQIIDNKAVT
ncbi:MAG: response regulator [Armatimonadetes bacterium]|nr:response regulator [Armatimonadota bacterium]